LNGDGDEFDATVRVGPRMISGKGIKLAGGTSTRTIEHRQGLKIMCLEEIGLELGYLTGEQVHARADALGKTGYADYLRRRVREIADG
jgi:dTDP-glucose pyrophosphorylase